MCLLRLDDSEITDARVNISEFPCLQAASRGRFRQAAHTPSAFALSGMLSCQLYCTLFL